MYARYVPAASKKADSGVPPVPRFGLATATYVPRAASPDHPPRALSPASKRKHDDSISNGASPAPRPKKSKSKSGEDEESGRRKSKMKETEQAPSDSDSTSDSSSSSDSSSEDEDDSEEDAGVAKKKKKEKRDKPKKKTAVVEESSDDDETAPRHKSIMAKKSKALQTAATIDEDAMDVDEPSDLEMHGLEPLPQPEPVAADTSKPTYETLPSWLAEPIRVAPDTRTPFADIGISAKASQALETKGFKDAFAVQTAAIPLLLPSSKHRQGDLLVAAATGSGKTLAYALPIVRDISGGQVTRLRALVVLPTRELVLQAQEVFQMCAAAFDSKDAKKVRIGISIGSQQLKQDQAALVEEVQRYDPRAYKQALRRFRGPWSFVEDSESDEDDEKIMPRPVASHLPDHVVDHKSRVDVLICTPGRLVDHINQTPGFSLDYVRWLVVDEADKLLAQSFQGWLDVVMPLLSTTKFSARDFPGSSLSGVRKVILSATLTRDLSLLGGLQLRWPQLIVLEGGKDGDKAQTAEHTLPSQLAEAAVRVYNTTLKPLYLLEVLQGDHLLAPAGSAPAVVKGEKKADDDTSSEEDSDTSSDESDSDTSSSSRDSDAEPKKPKTPAGAFTKTVLIFTKSNEAALRLSRLLALVSPPLAPLIGTLTSTQKTSHRRRVLSSFASGTLRILVASDLVARGIDLPALDNVVNYDLPASAAGYVHRVGRTARAGRAGKAITLVETRESGWFWGAVGKWAGIRRHADVERVRVGDREAEHVGFDAEKVEAYQEALAELGREAGEKKHK